MNIVVVGYGRMGQIIDKLAPKFGIKVKSTVDPINKTADHRELKEKAFENADVAIDFTTPKSVIQNINFYVANGINCVIGTTGWYEHLEEIEKKVEASDMGLIWSGNFSIGVNLLFRIINYSAGLMNKFPLYDVMGYEKHHQMKKDSPSGTMSMIGDILLGNLEGKKKIVTEKLDRKIEEDEIHLASVRGGDVPGTHVIEFDSEVDTVRLQHTARSREGFGVGALKAAKWIEKKEGFYSIENMMDEIIGG